MKDKLLGQSRSQHTSAVAERDQLRIELGKMGSTFRDKQNCVDEQVKGEEMGQEGRGMGPNREGDGEGGMTCTHAAAYCRDCGVSNFGMLGRAT